MPIIQAVRDATLQAVVQRCVPLFYTEGADPTSDRPAHVRAGSSLTWLGDRLALVQDDANFLVLVDPESGDVRALTLAAGEAGLRQFDDVRGNKRFKLDLEACTTVPTAAGDLFLAFGSGSTARREQILILSPGSSSPTLKAANALYAHLRVHTAFSGSELNIEGALFQDGRVRLLNRGNGAPHDAVLPVNAIGDLDWTELMAYLQEPEAQPAPQMRTIQQYDLGELNGLPLSFTDATVTQMGVIFSAAAEDSPDATADGRVTGSVLGILDDHPRWIELYTEDGNLFTGKVEGICASRTSEKHLFLVIDADDPALPCELCEVKLTGFW